MRVAAAACALVCSSVCLLAVASERIPLQACDTTSDRRLSEAELTHCFLTYDPTLKKMATDHVPPATTAKKEAADLAADAISTSQNTSGSPGEPTISFDEAAAYFHQRLLNTQQPRELDFGWDTLRIGRQLTDAADPRQKKYPAAFILSYLDNRQDKDDSFVALGDIRWWATRWGDSNLDIASSLDVATSKASSESTIDFTAAFSHVWLYSHDALIDGLGLGVEPKYATDRDFRRDVVQLTATLAPTSRRILRAGYNTPIGATSVGLVDNYILYWQPTLAAEFGSINDAGGNEALEALQKQGDYKRVVAGIGLKLMWPSSVPLSFNASYAYRWDVDEHWQRGFVATGLQYDLARNFALTLTYRNGRKPDTFEKTEEVLLGIGIMKTE
ncbi:MAG: hypothetical protein ACREV5_22235 [Steroidobacter sp.]